MYYLSHGRATRTRLRPNRLCKKRKLTQRLTLFARSSKYGRRGYLTTRCGCTVGGHLAFPLHSSSLLSSGVRLVCKFAGCRVGWPRSWLLGCLAGWLAGATGLEDWAALKRLTCKSSEVDEHVALGTSRVG